PLLAVFALFYLWPALVTVLSSFFRWGLLRPWSPVEPARWRFVGLDNYTTTLTDPSFWNAVLNTAIWLVVFPCWWSGSRCWCPSWSGTPAAARPSSAPCSSCP